MGYIRHHAIIVVDNGFGDGIETAWAKAVEIFAAHAASRLVSSIVEGTMNGQRSFFIAPDGSKEGWSHSDDADAARDELVAYLNANRDALDYLDFVEVSGFGGDDNDPVITRKSASKGNE